MTTKAITLNPIFTQDPKRSYIVNNRKAKIFKLAAIINFLVIAIFATYLLSLLSVSSATIPMIHIAIGIAAPILGISFSRLIILSKSYVKTAIFYKNVLKALNTLKAQSEEEIKKYLRKINSTPQDIKKSILAIAHFKAREIEKRFFLDEIEKLKKNDTTDQNLNYVLQKQIHEIWENEILRINLRQALIHHLIESPTSKKTLEEYGKVMPLSLGKRHASKLSNDDIYFIFKDKIQKQKQKKCLTSTQIRNLEISELSKIIFND
ncbi:MAG: hypothetical protein K1060chlam1_01122 [Candidatus Anoxychlamydiales bacterium]|nr:hypothetical protein [Candidatus Anoxychlamydiales bacterium]